YLRDCENSWCSVALVLEDEPFPPVREEIMTPFPFSFEMNVPPNLFPSSLPSPGRFERSPMLGTKPTSSRAPVPSSVSATPLPTPCKLFSEGFLHNLVLKGPLQNSVTKVTDGLTAIIASEGTSLAKNSTPKLPDVEGTIAITRLDIFNVLQAWHW
ncbi:hypothetical protein H0H81_002030, partial [Sphagnurus paluster]